MRNCLPALCACKVSPRIRLPGMPPLRLGAPLGLSGGRDGVEISLQLVPLFSLFRGRQARQMLVENRMYLVHGLFKRGLFGSHVTFLWFHHTTPLTTPRRSIRQAAEEKHIFQRKRQTLNQRNTSTRPIAINQIAKQVRIQYQRGSGSIRRVVLKLPITSFAPRKALYKHVRSFESAPPIKS